MLYSHWSPASYGGSRNVTYPETRAVGQFNDLGVTEAVGLTTLAYFCRRRLTTVLNGFMEKTALRTIKLSTLFETTAKAIKVWCATSDLGRYVLAVEARYELRISREGLKR